MKFPISLLSIIAILFMTGCATNFSKEMNSQIGKLSYDSAVQSWGKPKSIENLPNGNKIAKWTFEHNYVVPTHSVNNPSDPTSVSTTVSGGGVRYDSDILWITFSPRDLMLEWHREYR